MSRISFINIGTELLKGTIVNTNAANAGLILRKYGFRLDKVVMIADTQEAIAESLKEELAHADVVLISGGLGPTKDDITKFTLADYFGGEWKIHEPTLEFIKSRFEKAGIAFNELTASQANVPTSCEVMFNDRGTAPGMVFERDGSYVFSMPGVPYEMLHMLEQQAIPRIQQYFPSRPYHSHTFRLAEIPESEAANRMESIEKNLHPALQIAYLPRLDGLWLELSTQEEEEEDSLKILHSHVPQIRALFEDKIYVEGGELIAHEIQKLLLEKKLSLAVAESITGGRIGARLVEISGSSAYFKGGIVAYDTQAKVSQLSVPTNLIDQFGVVSEQVALSMADGVRKLLGADIGLATTGYAEPSRDQQAEVWIGLAGEHFSASRYAKLRTVRGVNLDRTAYYAMQLCLKKVRDVF